MVFPFDSKVYEPASGCWNADTDFCKNDMKQRNTPCIIVVSKELYENNYSESFRYWVGSVDVTKIYFGDKYGTLINTIKAAGGQIIKVYREDE